MKNRIARAASKILLLLSMVLLTILMKAQSIERYAISSTGGYVTGGAYTLNFTCGETIAQTLENEKQLSQGFQQVWLITTSVGENISDTWDVNLFPNPTSALLNIESGTPLKARIADSMGHIVLEKQMDSGREVLDLTTWPSGIYFAILNGDQQSCSKTFRIVKVQ